MISLNKLAEEIQEKLKNKGFNFHIVSDTGRFKKSERVGNEVIQYVNGLLTSGLSEVTNLTPGKNPLIYATQTAYLSLILPLSNSEEDMFLLSDGNCISKLPEELDEGVEVVQEIYGNKTKIAKLRAVLNSVFQGVFVENMTDENGKTFSVTAIYQLLESGTRSQNPIIGNSFTFSINIYYSFVENGINTKDMIFYLDGVPIPFQSYTFERLSVMDGNVYADTTDGMAENFTSQTTLNISFELPAIANNTVTSAIINYMVRGRINQAHLLRFTQTGGITEDYIVGISGGRLSGETIKNVGQSLTFVPIRKNYALINFNDNVKIYSADSNDYTIKPQEDAITYVFGKGKGFYPPAVKSEITGLEGDKIVTTKELLIATNLRILEKTNVG